MESTTNSYIYIAVCVKLFIAIAVHLAADKAARFVFSFLTAIYS